VLFRLLSAGTPGWGGQSPIYGAGRPGARLKVKGRWSTLKTMNEQKRNVRVRLTTVNDGRKSVVRADGEAYLRGGHTYIRYAEPSPELSGVTTTVKLGVDGIAVLRHGAVRAEQRFVVGKPAVGYYETGQGTFRLETLTERMDVRFEGGVGTASWSYRLTVGGAEAGHFQLNLDVREAESSI